jgi:hypothetical protein
MMQWIKAGYFPLNTLIKRVTAMESVDTDKPDKNWSTIESIDIFKSILPLHDSSVSNSSTSSSTMYHGHVDSHSAGEELSKPKEIVDEESQNVDKEREKNSIDNFNDEQVSTTTSVQDRIQRLKMAFQGNAPQEKVVSKSEIENSASLAFQFDSHNMTHTDSIDQGIEAYPIEDDVAYPVTEEYPVVDEYPVIDDYPVTDMYPNDDNETNITSTGVSANNSDHDVSSDVHAMNDKQSTVSVEGRSSSIAKDSLASTVTVAFEKRQSSLVNIDQAVVSLMPSHLQKKRPTSVQ